LTEFCEKLVEQFLRNPANNKQGNQKNQTNKQNENMIALTDRRQQVNKKFSQHT